MGRIQTNIGLITGVPIGDTVEALMELAAKPRDLLIGRIGNLQAEQAAVNELAAMLLSVRYVTDQLGRSDYYHKLKVTSSNPDVLSATLKGTPPLGTYRFTPLRMVQSQQLVTSGVRSETDPLGGGELTFRFGDHLQRSARLEWLNGGWGVQRGKIRIFDRSGASAEIDLSTVQTVEDVLEAINANSAINVTAAAHGDGIRLTDHTGQSVSHLRVQEVGNGTTAASLGLDGIDVAADVADGADVVRLDGDLDLQGFNDGNGVHISSVFPELEYELRDGTTGRIDFSAKPPGSTEVDETKTLDDLLEVINSAEPDKLKVEIAPDGDRLIVTDLTEGEGAFRLTPFYDLETLADLGLDGPAVDGQIVGRRIMGGTGTVLLSSLNGGQGLGELGTLELTDRSGAFDTVDLSAAETLQDVIHTINEAGVGIVARINQARHGIELVDTTGAQAGHLIVANGDETATADKLAVAVDDDVTVTGSGDMHLQVVSHHTRLDDLNGGAGVARAGLTVVDSSGAQAKLDLTSKDIQTIDDLIRKLNQLPRVRIQAEINPSGDGILVRDLASGTGTPEIREGNSTTAKDLHLLGPARQVQIGGEMVQAIDGSMTQVIELDEGDSLQDLRNKINELDAGVTATTFVDGSSRPFRLALVSEQPGKAGQLVFDTSQIGLSLTETARAQDALLLFGEGRMAASGLLVSSTSNTFRDVLPGVALTIEQAAEEPVTVTVDGSDADLVGAVQTMVDNYNKLRNRLAELTAYDLETDTRSVLTGDAAALRLDTELSYLFSGRFGGVGVIQSLAELGITTRQDGTLEFDAEKLKARFAADPDAVEEFFTKQQLGVSDKFDTLIEQIAGENNSLLSQRIDTLSRKIEQNQKRVDFLNARLDVQRERLFMQFYRMEIAIGKIQANLSAVESIQPLAPLALSNNRK